ncbi:MAG: hypothetical protein D6826_09675 [Alphaproteobacteria bacterium]|nr:MAG: hypothetical protein D6826_09675 [Alphaproteobacteria bacterium]
MPWPLPDDEAELVHLAKSYPFAAPEGSYLFSNGKARPLAAASRDDDPFAGRTPVIAHGSNRSPAQLRRKFGRDGEIPVTRAWLADYDVVYSAHVTRYGSVAANLHHVPGVRVAVFVTWLNAAQLARMHETELGGENYRFGRLSGIDLVVEAGGEAMPALDEAWVYLSTRGCLAIEGAPVGLAAVAAHGRPHRALDQEALLSWLWRRHRHRPDLGLDGFILENIRNAGRRAALTATLAAEAMPMAAPHFRADD